MYPDDYISDITSDFPQECGFDYKFTGTVNERDALNCFEESADQDISDFEFKRYCTSESFFNPRNENIIGNYGSNDYFRVKEPSQSCSLGQAVLPGFSNCMFYEISDNYIRFTTIGDIQNPDGLEFYCSSANEGTEYTYRSFTNEDGNLVIEKHDFKCPNQERFRRTMQIYNSYFAADPFEGDGFEYTERYIPEIIPEPSSGSSASSFDPNHRETPTPSFVPPTFYDPGYEEIIAEEKENNYLGMGITKQTFLVIVAFCVVFILLCIAIPLAVKYWILPLIETQSEKEENAEVSESSETQGNEEEDHHKRRHRRRH